MQAVNYDQRGILVVRREKRNVWQAAVQGGSDRTVCPLVPAPRQGGTGSAASGSREKPGAWQHVGFWRSWEKRVAAGENF